MQDQKKVGVPSSQAVGDYFDQLMNKNKTTAITALKTKVTKPANLPKE